MEFERERIPLLAEDVSYFYNKRRIEELKEELEEFLAGPGKYMNSKIIAEKFLGCEEIQANNSIEGYNDDADVIKKVIADGYNKKMPKKRFKIIRNLHEGYQMILQGKEINKVNLKYLYDILSNGLLSDYDLAHMGDYYRKGEVEIYYSPDLSKEPDKGIDYLMIEEYMDNLFAYLNNGYDFDTMTDYYVKSQISHLYFAYVHPYFDVNGRTARTLSMWYLINNKAYPFIIFNRAIPFDRSNYIRVIRDTKKFRNMTYFLNFMMTHLKVELEKEFVINSISDSLNLDFSAEEYQTLRYILSMNGLKTVKDFTSFYNRFNDKKRFMELKREAIDPLVDKDVLSVVRYTKGGEEGDANFVFELNSNNFDNDPNKIKRLKL